jgi:hypothetical protein
MFLRTAAAAGEQQTQGLLAIEQADCIAADDFRLEGPQPSPTAGITQPSGQPSPIAGVTQPPTQ